MHRFRPTKFTLVSIFALLLALVANVVLFRLQLRPVSANFSLYTPISGSFVAVPNGTQMNGPHPGNDPLTVTVALQPSNAAQMNNMLIALYNPASPQYHHWLTVGQFNAQFAPPGSQMTQVQNFLQGAALQVGTSPSPFLVQATGTTSQVESAFKTTINDYTSANGQTFYQNASPAQMPTSMNSIVMGVAGLSNTAQEHPNYMTTMEAAQSQGKALPNYGAGPGGSGLVPSQLASLYGATGVYGQGPKGQGAGTTLAVYELSGYTPADIATYEHQFFGATENVALQDINVDGGPLTPNCPPGDTCIPNDYAGDIEVDADIETQIAITPKIDRILVYNAPNDSTGMVSDAEYFQIAQDDQADVVSISWGGCEQDFGMSHIQIQSLAFEQMALQGQSVFASAGDTGAYDCLRGSGNPALTVDDPSSQPFVTSVGGTSFEAFDPGTNPNPTYPQGQETAWNVLNACNGSATGMMSCAKTGASGGGVSAVWGRPAYQNAPNVTSSLSQQAPYCALAVQGQYCRQIPDISANADEYTPYAEFCTGNVATNSTCAIIAGKVPIAGWFGIGGTSLSSPLWSGIIGIWDSVHGARFGSANFGLYALYQSNNAYSSYFHDITGVNQTENNNGFYPTTPNYDMATGIGTPLISNIVTANF